MLGTSLLLHGGVIGIAAIWMQPEPPEHSVVLDWDDVGIPQPLPSQGPEMPARVEPPESTAAPEIDSKIEPTPPDPTNAPDFATPPLHTPPPHRAVSTTTASVRPASTQTASRSTSSQTNGATSGGSNAGASGVVGVWVTPHPPYPAVGLAIHATGATTVRVTTDASGRVSNVVIVRSAGNPVLDNQTESFVRMNWHGPPNAARTTQFVYQIR